MDLIKKIREAIKSDEKAKRVVLIRADINFYRGEPSDATAIASVGSGPKVYSLRWNPLKDGFEILKSEY